MSGTLLFEDFCSIPFPRTLFSNFWRLRGSSWMHFGSTSGPMTLPKVPPGLQNGTLEPPKFIKKSDLDPPGCQEVAPEASEVPPQPQFSWKIMKMRSNLTENVEKFFAQQCKLTFKNIMEMHLELYCFFFCEATCKDSVTAAGWAKPTRIKSLKQQIQN